MDNQVPEKTKKEGIYDFLKYKSSKFDKRACVHNCKCQNDNSVRANSRNKLTRNNWNCHLNEISVRILLQKVDYSLSISIINESAFGLINYHLIEIESE